MSSKEYFTLNVLFAALLFCLFTIAALSTNHDHFVECQVVKFTGKVCESCGLTRDFISFAHLEFRSPINQQSIFVFLWFFLQWIARIILAFLPFSTSAKLKWVDLFLSAITCVLVFLPFWI